MLALLLVLLVQPEPTQKPPTAAAATPRTRAILARLEEPIAMEVPGEAALEDVLDHIRRSVRKGPNDPGIPIYIDPPGLWRAGRTMSATVRINAPEGRSHARPGSPGLHRQGRRADHQRPVGHRARTK